MRYRVIRDNAMWDSGGSLVVIVRVIVIMNLTSESADAISRLLQPHCVCIWRNCCISARSS